MNSQSGRNTFVDSLRMQVRWCTFGPDINPFVRYNPWRPFVHWLNSRRMNDYVSKHIEGRFSTLQTSGDHLEASGQSIIDLVLTAYLKEDPVRKTQPLDSTFKKFAVNQIKLFLFSGHDTTSSTVCYLYYTLASKPDILARVRSEHNKVLGADVCQTSSLVAANPVLLNRLSYTTAFIKETLRLYPAVSSLRAGEPGFQVTDELGRQFPTDELLVWSNPVPIHRDPAYWHQPDDFLPDRWLVGPDNPLHPVKGAWRPFEHGPRNCIGQELAMIEMKVILVMTARKFRFSLAYDTLDGAHDNQRIKTVHGERGYRIDRAQPAGDLPCRVSESTW